MHSQCEAGDALADFLLSMYAAGTLSAKSVCIACHWAVRAGSQGKLLKPVAMRPAAGSDGNYKKRLDRAMAKRWGMDLTPAAEEDSLPIPSSIKGQRVEKLVPVACAYECLESEILANEDEAARIDECLEGTDWPDSFVKHEKFVSTEPGDNRKVYPCALYCDGVRYTSSIGAGKMDIVTVITVQNLASGKRHLLGAFPKREACSCGCRGWCGMYVFMKYLAYCFKAASDGVRPLQKWNGALRCPGSRLGKLARERPKLDARFVLTELRGDWLEMCSLFGFPTWARMHHPCIYCCTSHDDLLDFNHLTAAGHGWGSRPPNWYTLGCQANTIEVRVATERDRNDILEIGGLTYIKKRGRVLKHPVARFGLCKHDRLDPSEELPNIAGFDDAELPFTAKFWRVHSDEAGRGTNQMSFHNPLFAGTAIHPDMFVVDTLHCVYLGVYVKYVESVIWRAISCNVFKVHGAKSEVLESSARFLFADIKLWYRRAAIPTSDQLNDLTTSMLGTWKVPALHTKAHETGVLLGWAIDFSSRHLEMHDGQALHEAGRALGRYKEILDEANRRLTLAQYTEIMEECIKHLSLAEDAGMKLLPKHHQWVHCNLRSWHFGNPKSYSCFLDESLNANLASIAKSSHRSTWWKTIFYKVRLLALLGANQHLA